MPDLDLATMAKEVADRIDRRNLVMAFGGLAHETWVESAVPEILAALQRVQAETREEQETESVVVITPKRETHKFPTWAEVHALRATLRTVAEASKQLRSSLSSWMIDEARSVWGNTNTALLEKRLDTFDTALALDAVREVLKDD